MCQKYVWALSTDMDLINYFSYVRPTPDGSDIDLLPFIVNGTLSKIQYQNENTRDVSGQLELFTQVTNVTFNIGNLSPCKESTMPDEFFGVYSRNANFKFVVNIYDDNNVNIFRGMIDKSGIQFADREQEQIKITVLGFEKEFKKYYEYKTLTDYTDWIYPLPTLGIPIAYLRDVISYNFINAFMQIEMSEGVKQYMISKHPFIYSPMNQFTRQMLFFRTGYESFRRDGCSVFDWFNSICVSKGWVWGFYLNTLFIRERGVPMQEEVEIDYNRTAIKHNVVNTLYDHKTETVLIEDGKFYSNGVLLSPEYSPNRVQGVAGNRTALYSEKKVVSNETLPFNKLVFIPSDYNMGTYEINYRNKTMVYGGEGGSTGSRYHRFSLLDIYNPYPRITRTEIRYSSTQVLRLTPYVCTEDSSAGIDINNARYWGGRFDIGAGNFYSKGNQMNDTDFRYTGHAGESLYKQESNGFYTVYSDYIKSKAFADNMRPLLGNELKVSLELEIKGLYTNPMVAVRVVNYPYYPAINGKKLILQTLSYDLNNQTSEMGVIFNE